MIYFDVLENTVPLVNYVATINMRTNVTYGKETEKGVPWAGGGFEGIACGRSTYSRSAQLDLHGTARLPAFSNRFTRMLAG